MKRPSYPTSDQREADAVKAKPSPTLAGHLAKVGDVFRKTGEFVSDHKWQTLSAAAIALTLAGGINHIVTEAQNNADTDARGDIQEEFKGELDEIAVQMANPADIIPGSTIHDPGNHLYDRALEFAEANGLDYQEGGVNTLLQTAVAISKANYIHPGADFVISEVDADHDGDTEPVVQLAPVDLETLDK